MDDKRIVPTDAEQRSLLSEVIVPLGSAVLGGGAAGAAEAYVSHHLQNPPPDDPPPSSKWPQGVDSE